MKLKKILLASCLCFCSYLFADVNHHVYPDPDARNSQPKNNKLKWPGYCEIEIINDSYTNVRVYGMFDDGVILHPFVIYTYEYPHFISLFYYGYCHEGMYLHVDTLSGYPLYDDYTPTNSTLHIIPYMMANRPKVEIKANSPKF